MTKRLYTPSLPELFRVDATSVETAELHLTSIYLDSTGKFNYLNASKILQSAYKGFHDIEQLVAGCEKAGSKVGRKPNAEVVRLAAPEAFGRKAQVFQLPKRSFHFGKDRAAPFRVPFFFVENEVIKICFLQPRKNGGLNLEQCGGLFTVLKKHLLDQEFYGEKTDIEYIDVSAPNKKEARKKTVYSLNDISLWNDEKLSNHLTIISQALENLEKAGLAEEIKPRRPFKDPDLPLFD
ncbi:hypothetical protein FMN63_20960 [Stappia sp. BW2]|uniref:hypothetical protein n=1 Tax=Stappia sp. BW2 TaxID=2592622 RepID=UPI0011DEB697|nr:hypothetical protein [Stappia sp. BW2]TYC64922.1 hypothetical protein FMN63_20960 [Stappia sp. BW2]